MIPAVLLFAEKIVHCFRLNVWWIVETSSHSPGVFRPTLLLERNNKSQSHEIPTSVDCFFIDGHQPGYIILSVVSTSDGLDKANRNEGNSTRDAIEIRGLRWLLPPRQRKQHLHEENPLLMPKSSQLHHFDPFMIARGDRVLRLFISQQWHLLHYSYPAQD